MKKILLLLTLSVIITDVYSQVIHKIKADSVLITNDACNAELNLENSTKHVKGFLYNKGNGRTEFRRSLKLNDSTLIIGNDTLTVGNGNGWLLNGNINTTGTNFLGTRDDKPIIFKTNNIARAQLTSGKYGGFVIGYTKAEGSLHVYGRDIVDTTSTMTISGNIDGLQWGNSAGKTMGRLIRLNQGTTVSGGQNFYDIGIGQDTSLFITNHSVPPVGVNGSIRKRMFVISPDDKVGINLAGDVIGNGAKPTANFHTNGTVRFQNLPAGDGFILVSDNNGNIFKTNESLAAAGGTLWSLTGNAGANPATNFLGTKDNNPLIFKTNNETRVTMTSSRYGGLVVGSPTAEGYFTVYGKDVVDSTTAMFVSSNIAGLQWGNTRGKTMGRLIRLNQGNTHLGGENFYDIGIGQDTSLFITNHSVPPGSSNGVIRKRMLVISPDDKVGINLAGDAIGNGARPTANFHTSGTVRHQDLPSGNGFILVSDINGNIYKSNESLATAGGTLWSLTGNTATNPATHFIGTTDNQSLHFKTRNTRRLSIDGAGAKFTLYDSTGNATLDIRINGTLNQFIGFRSGIANTTGAYNTASGYEALLSNTTGQNNAATGTHSMNLNTTGSNNTATGASSLRLNTTGASNTAAGAFALFSNSTGFGNTATGHVALNSNTIGNQNVAAGYMSMYGNTEGSYNTAIGGWALKTNTTGYNNTAHGFSTLFLNTTGRDNTAIGFNVLYSNTTGNFNSATGTYSLFANTTGNNNAAFGIAALKSNTTGIGNTANGMQALYSNTTAAQNTASGHQTLYNNTTGENNTAMGAFALWTNTTGSNNIVMGNGAAYQLSSGNYNQIYGASVQAPNPSGNGQLNIGNVVYGTNLYQSSSLSSTPVANGNIGIGGIPASCAKLEITSTTQGLLLPRMTKAQRDAIASPVAGLMIFQTDNTPGLRVHNGTNWVRYTEVTD